MTDEAATRARSVWGWGWEDAGPGPEHREGILGPGGAIEPGGEEPAGLIPQHRIHREGEGASEPVASLQMPADPLVGHRQEPLVRAIKTADPRFVADPADPFIAARRLIA